jgi:hypothetical protein
MPVPAGFPIDLIEAERDFADIRGEVAALPPEKVPADQRRRHHRRDHGTGSGAEAGTAARADGAAAGVRDPLARPASEVRARGVVRLPANLPTAATAEELRELEARGTELREKMRAFAVPLVATKVFEASVIAALNAGTGTKDLANDLVQYAVLYRTHWPQVQEQIKGLTEAETLETGNLGSRLLSATAARELSRDAVGGRTELRNRAWSVYDIAYDQCRRAVAFLRHDEGDVDQLIPSFRQQATGRRRAEEPAEPVVDRPAPPPAPQPAPPSPAPGPGRSASEAAACTTALINRTVHHAIVLLWPFARLTACVEQRVRRRAIVTAARRRVLPGRCGAAHVPGHERIDGTHDRVDLARPRTAVAGEW